jgi:predicted Rossmann fold flavoprotein
MNQCAPWDVVVVGAGAAGLFCAGVAGQRGLRVLVIDHASVLGEKIRISGGGRCNFTNLHSNPTHFLCKNPGFVDDVLHRYPPSHFIALVKKYGITFHEKHRGQLFCNESSKVIVEMLMAECRQNGVTIRHPLSVQAARAPHNAGVASFIEKELKHHNLDSNKAANESGLWILQTSNGFIRAHQLVVATGGLTVPAIGASAWGLELARQLRLAVTSVQPGLVPLALDPKDQQGLASLAGLSLSVEITAGQADTDRLKHRDLSEANTNNSYGQGIFNEDLLFTHKGLSGPAVLQASSYWQAGESISINWLAKENSGDVFDESRHGGKRVDNLLAQFMPQRLAQAFSDRLGLGERRWAELGKKDRARVTDYLTNWQVKPAGTLGWKKAEVMLGGIDTKELNAQTMMTKRYKGLHFIGECLDVTGHLGGHNFQWAWASGFVCAQALKAAQISASSEPH